MRENNKHIYLCCDIKKQSYIKKKVMTKKKMIYISPTLEYADEIWVIGEENTKMKGDILIAKKQGLPTKYFNLNLEPEYTREKLSDKFCKIGEKRMNLDKSFEKSFEK